MPSPTHSLPDRFATRARASALCLAMLCATSPATAAKVYRCGNAFQDQPCPEVKIAAITPVERPAETLRPSTRDTPCVTRDGRSDCGAKIAAPRDAATDVRR